MARTTTVVVALLVAIGCVVAMLPAQESSRRRTSTFKAPASEAPAPLGETAAAEPGLVPLDPMAAGAPLAQVPPAPNEPSSVLVKRPAPGSLSGQLDSLGEAAAQDYAGLPPAGNESAPAFAPAPDNPAPYQPVEVAAAPGSLSPPPQPPVRNAFAPLPPAGQAQPGQAPVAEMPAEGGPPSILKRPPASPVARPQSPPSAQAPPAFAPVSPSDANGSSRRTIPSPQNEPPTSRLPLGTAPSASRVPSSLSEIVPSSIQGLTLSGRSPALRVDVAGPAGITVGKPASYVVNLVNEGDAAAQDVQLRLALPSFVTVSGTNATSGEAMMHADASGLPRLVWNVPSVGGRGHQTLRLSLVASEGQAFDFGIEWAARPATAKVAIAVKQAQLQLTLSGPGDMLFGDEKNFTLTISNPGTGDAENVLVNLSAGMGHPQQFEVGTIPAGQRKEVSVKVAASQAGEMELRAVATADGNLSAEGAGKVIVRKAELAVAVEGPQLKYAGTDAAYLLTVQNRGNAPADNVQVSLALPAAAKYLGGVTGAAAVQNSVKWKIPALPPGSEKTFEVHLQLQAPGLNRVIAQAQGASGLVASGEAQTEVEAAADLKLVVNDPAGPLPTSEHAVYEVQVMNRGSQTAQQVKIVVQFSEGFEPVAFDGCEAKLVPGQVVCQPLPQLGAGEQVTLRIKARADKGGTHQFRVEVTSTDSGTRLVSEGTTRFFTEVGRPGGAAASTARPAAPLLPSSTIQR